LWYSALFFLLGGNYGMSHRKSLIKQTTTAFLALMFLISACSWRGSNHLLSGTLDNSATANELLWYQYPAVDWDGQALHLGNGRMGASFYGGVREERFDITEESMWQGGPGMKPLPRYGIKPGGAAHVKKMRDAIVAGDVALADKLVLKHLRGDYGNFGAFSMIGNLYFTFDNHDGATSEYRRQLDLSKSLASVSYKTGSVKYQREYFCSYPDQVMVMRFTCDTPGKLSFTMRQTLVNADSTITINGNELLVSGKINTNSRNYRVRIKVLNDGGTLSVDGDNMILTGANGATVIYAAATEYMQSPPDYKGADPGKITTERISAAACKSYKQLKRRHVDDYRELYGRVTLKLAGDAALEKLPTNQRWETFKNGNHSDTGLQTMLFNLGRYLLISSSRPGTLPSTLQGVWNTYAKAPWHGNYQSNINLQEMYWASGPTNLLECQRAYVDYTKALVVPGRAVAKSYYGTRGWVSHTTGNIWGYAAPGRGLSWGIYPVGAAWHCQHLWDHYAFSMNEKYLREEAYPVMREAALFWLENLVPYKGYLISAPTVSAEHGAKYATGSAHGYNIPGAYQDIEMIHDLFTNVIQAADILGIDAEFRNIVEASRAKLLPLKIGKHGQLQEWYADIDSPDDNHRHISHLYGVHPGRMIDPLKDKNLADAARQSLNMRGDGWMMPKWIYSGGNWARTWRVWCWARLLDGERANKIFTEMIAEQGFENLMTFQHIPTRNPGRGPHPVNRLQVDGSMSTPGFMAEMLLQSHLGEIHILPALPSAWPRGKVEGLIARGAYVVDIEWDNGRLLKAKVKATKGGIPKIRIAGELIDPDKDPRVTF
jgi:alpha-L-fucosidase 2